MSLQKRYSLVVFALVFAGCRHMAPTAESTVLEQHDIPTELVTSEAVRSFLDHASALAASGESGTLGIDEFVNVMPMEDDERQEILNSYTTPFDVSCSEGRCAISASGSSVSAVMNVTIDVSGISVTNPSLALSSSVTAEYVMRGADTIEFCNVDGMKVKKLFVSKPVQGLQLGLVDGAPTLRVNTGDDEENYTCE